MLAILPNKKYPNQKQSDLNLACLSRHFGRQQVFEILEHYLSFNQALRL